jgi:parallel beta-helix repeat protein
MKYLRATGFLRFVLIAGFMVLQLFFYPVSATDYYLSANGNDLSNGTSAQSGWQSISKLNQAWAAGAVKAGDRIYFKRGDTFIGQIEAASSGNASANILISAYGTGDKPVISGAVKVVNWQSYNGSVYQSVVDKGVAMVVRNNKFMIPARYPNSGFLTIDASNGKNGFTDAALNQPAGYWNNANVRVRCRNWIYQTGSVASFSNGTIVFSSALNYDTRANYGYYIDNVFSQLDADGEWFYQAAEKKLFLQFPSGASSSDYDVYASVYQYGIVLKNGIDHVVVDNILFKYQSSKSIWVDGDVTSVTIKNCDVLFCGFNAIDAKGAVVIESNRISQAMGSGIYLENGNGAQIINNTVENVGLLPGQGTDKGTSYHGIMLSGYNGQNCLVQGNIVRNCGYNGISVYGLNNKVTRNYITNVLLSLNDGGAIYLSGTQTEGNQIIENVVDSIVGNADGSASTFFGAAGIYLDDYSASSVVRGNAVSHSSSVGLFISDSQANTLTGNKVYLCDVAGISVENPNDNFMTSHIITQNQVVLANASAVPLNIYSSANLNFPAKCDSNYLANLLNPYAVAYHYVNASVVSYDLPKWTAFAGCDLHSSENDFIKAQQQPNVFQGDTLIRNYGFNAGVDGWEEGWPNNATLSYVSNSKLTQGAILFTLDVGTTQSGKLASHDFSMTQNQMYLLSFDVVSDDLMELQLNLVDQALGSSDISWKAVFPVAKKTRHYQYSIMAPRTSAQYRLEYRIRSAYKSFQLDNVFLRAMTSSDFVTRGYINLFTNPSGQKVALNLGGTTWYTLTSSSSITSYQLDPWQSVFLVTAQYGSQLSNIDIVNNYSFRLFPNPVKAGSLVSIQIPDTVGQSFIIDIYALNGAWVGKLQVERTSEGVTFMSPKESGVFIVSIESIANKMSFRDKLIVF